MNIVEMADIVTTDVLETMHDAHIVFVILKDDKMILIKHDEVLDYLKDPDKWLRNV
jgi:hypothetical protein